jgi:integrating conjugative element protein (TIGR03761 family)
MKKSKEKVSAELSRLFNKSGGDAGNTGLALSRPSLSMPSLAGARNEQIGALRGDASVTIHTKQAQLILTGREATNGRSSVMGLMRFSGILAQITVAAKQDDPWADWYLVQVEDRLEEAKNALEQQLTNIESVLKSETMMNVQISQSITPLKVAIGFSASYAYAVARTILLYDTVVRAALTAHHVALMSQEAKNKLLNDAGTHLRRVFETSARYRVTGLTRADVEVNHMRVADAVAKMGSLPADILDKSRRAKFAPAIFTANDQPSSNEAVATAEIENIAVTADEVMTQDDDGWAT